MMIVMKEGASRQEVAAVINRVESVGAKAHVSEGELVTVIGAIGDREHVANLQLEGYPGVDHVTPITKPYKLASTQFRKGERSVLDIGGRKIGGPPLTTIAGAGTAEAPAGVREAARHAAGAGAPPPRRGARKPRAPPDPLPGPCAEGR